MYALQTMSDDLATTHYRTAGGQIAPLIISTRGHRLEGIWHSGSPLSMVINSIRGVYVCVPRNMTQAAGFYNTLLEDLEDYDDQLRMFKLLIEEQDCQTEPFEDVFKDEDRGEFAKMSIDDLLNQ